VRFQQNFSLMAPQAKLFTTIAPLVLASGSPRRRQMLADLGITFTVVTASVDERPRPDEDPFAYVERLAMDKATAVATQHPDHWILAADTIVVLNDTMLGKPTDADEARAMLTRLSGELHRVITGVCLLHERRGTCHRFACRTTVRFAQLAPALIDAYVATGEPLDKAGAYGIQGLGGCLVKSIEGSYSNVVGLPLAETVAALLDASIIVPAGRE